MEKPEAKNWLNTAVTMLTKVRAEAEKRVEEEWEEISRFMALVEQKIEDSHHKVLFEIF